MRKITFLYLIIFLEGYVVLSAELLAMRQVIPYAGSGTDSTSIIIAAVLMPLAIGYYYGGRFKQKRNFLNKKITVRKKLLQNIFISAIIFTIGLSYLFIEFFYTTLFKFGLSDRILTTTIYSILFLVFPVFLLAQTIPLISNYFRKETLSLITGKILFFSTLGSFMGAIFTTLVLMALIGVHLTATLTVLCLCFLYIFLSKKKFTVSTFAIVLIGVAAIYINNPSITRTMDIVESNQYNIIKVKKYNNGHTRMLMLNNNKSSLYTDKDITNSNLTVSSNPFKYINFINENFIWPLAFIEEKRKVLIIGAGGFTLGVDDIDHDYTYVDIDKSLKRISEEYFLKRKLEDNKRFEPVPARSFLYQAKQKNQKFDLIILDTYQGAKTMPEHLLTKEYYAQIRDVLSDDGIVVINFITSANFNTLFSQKINNTLLSVFPHITRQVVNKNDFLNERPDERANVIYIYHHHKKENTDSTYTDNVNRTYYDKWQSMNE